jgi:DNA-binding YbaB/EbfC family protein
MKTQNVPKMLKSLQALQQKAAEAKKEIASMKFQGTSGGGLVKLTMTGKGEILELEISPEAMAEGEGSVVAELVIAAFQAAVSQKEAFSARKLKELAGFSLPFGMKLPGLDD